MMRSVPSVALAALFASAGAAAHAAPIELVATSQFVVQGATVYRSLEPPVTLLVAPSPFGRPVLVTTGPLGARLLDPARVVRDPADPDAVRVDTSGPQEDFLSVRPDGPNLVLEREGVTMALKEGPPLLGDHQLGDLLQALPEYRRGAAHYAPDAAALARLRRVKQPAELLVFFGSWCPHCEQAVPRLVRALEELHGAPITATFHGVPHDARWDDPLIERFHIVGLPTAIVERDGREIARLEGDQWARPETSLADLMAGPPR
jgi:thiol-disulfide isomerase/thioredoxin